jgi:hypothetical protein
MQLSILARVKWFAALQFGPLHTEPFPNSHFHSFITVLSVTTHLMLQRPQQTFCCLSPPLQVPSPTETWNAQLSNKRQTGKPCLLNTVHTTDRTTSTRPIRVGRRNKKCRPLRHLNRCRVSQCASGTASRNMTPPCTAAQWGTEGGGGFERPPSVRHWAETP